MAGAADATPLPASARRRVAPLMAVVVGTRVLGITLVLPVFTPYGLELTDSAFLVGLALGAYGLTMALLQVPLGHLSDRLGRKPVLLLGFAVSAAGFVLGWWARDIGTLLVARLLQGGGAVTGVSMALVADSLGEARRTTGMAVVGAGVGVGASGGLIAGPLLEPALGVPGLFLLAGLMTVVTMVLVAALVPAVPPGAPARESVWRTLVEPVGLRLNGAGFAAAFALNAVVFALPLEAARFLGPRGYGVALGGMVLVGGLGMFLAARWADRGHARAVLFGALGLLGAAPALLLAAPWLALFLVGGALFFVAHSSLSASVPSLNAAAFPGRRGAALGAFNVAQYLGAFVGGAAAGLLVRHPMGLTVGILGVVLLSALLLASARLPSAVRPSRGPS